MKKLIIVALIAFVYSSCSYYVAPPYANVSELIKVRKGMSMTQVNDALGIRPYDIYTVQDDGGTILMYNYRVKERKMSVFGNFNKITKSERGQKEGITHYSDPSRAYVLFENDKVASVITDYGREDAELLMITNNNLQLITEQDLVDVAYNNISRNVLIMNEDGSIKTLEVPVGEETQSDKSIVLPVKKKNKKQVKKEKKEKKKGGALKKVGITYLAIGAAVLIILLIAS